MVDLRTIEKLHFPREGQRNPHQPQQLASEVYKILGSAPTTSKWHKWNCNSWPFATNNHGRAAIWPLLLSKTSAQKTHDPPQSKASAAPRAVENLTDAWVTCKSFCMKGATALTRLKSWCESLGPGAHTLIWWVNGRRALDTVSFCSSCSCKNTMRSRFRPNNAAFFRNWMSFLLIIRKHCWSVVGSASYSWLRAASAWRWFCFVILEDYSGIPYHRSSVCPWSVRVSEFMARQSPLQSQLISNLLAQSKLCMIQLCLIKFTFSISNSKNIWTATIGCEVFYWQVTAKVLWRFDTKSGVTCFNKLDFISGVAIFNLWNFSVFQLLAVSTRLLLKPATAALQSALVSRPAQQALTSEQRTDTPY